ncbi:4-amino-4-deoxy-L-arabinose-phosphoundecaprenol flippase subunit ArnE [Prochlorococcus marinus str. MIT 1313]|uniref:hypothetical protein n=1 Tax=Prochlorococcus TaxID=1218 RepID=UPI0007B3264A|nr:hypothetical protein [Prochlorococcus marinus]KZR70114.1 4-amino-4-deoxy-L-arabinose-phosphoundecaprenol flippase subunit ArnE [Prochlorococcus marinus str. MIT 1313]KZR72837.1 4-amino-4-deoxy-L-arabinose-phosphoundecaprenol flippase subunit ArnE [Prochlorococcus marinus str. MIT 1318]
MSGFLLFLLYAGLMTFGQFLFKQTAEQFKTLSPVSVFDSIAFLIGSPRFLSACVVYAAATLLWVVVLTQFNLSVAYPVVISLSVLFTVLIGVIVFSEPLTIYGVLGLGSVVIGIMFLAKNAQ